MNQPAKTPAKLGEMLDWMSSLADPTRARILRIAERNELSVAELCAVLQAPQSTAMASLGSFASRRPRTHGWVMSRPSRVVAISVNMSGVARGAAVRLEVR